MARGSSLDAAAAEVQCTETHSFSPRTAGMDLLGIIHLATAILAIVSGAAVLLVSPKGTRRHRGAAASAVVMVVATRMIRGRKAKLLASVAPRR